MFTECYESSTRADMRREAVPDSSRQKRSNKYLRQNFIIPGGAKSKRRSLSQSRQ